MRLISVLIILLATASNINAQSVLADMDIYHIEEGDSTINPAFVLALCEAARNKAGSDDPNFPSRLESLMVAAAGTTFRAEDQKEKIGIWWVRFGNNCYCEPYKKKYPRGNILRQIVYADFRAIANYIGPHGRLAVDLRMPDEIDGLNILEYVAQEREKLESKYQNDRLKFQNDKTWKKVIFYYMLFTEYKVQRLIIEDDVKDSNH